MAFSKQQLQKFADLIKIDISDEQLEKMNIDSVIEWIDKLKQIDTIRDAIMANAPDKSGVSRGYFAVPKVMDGD